MSEKFKSASSGQAVGLGRKLDEAARQFGKLLRQRSPFSKRSFARFGVDLAEYKEVCTAFGGFDLGKARAFELGCGQRPYRLFHLIASGIDAQGIDMDKVTFSMGPSDIAATFRKNGFERTAKTTLRYYLFDIAENRQFRAFLSDIAGRRFDWPLQAISNGDASVSDNWPDGQFDFVYSEDVFEHIPQESLSRLCALLAERLSDRGIALIRPMIFTGIRGGHNVEYYSADPGRTRNCPPWDHLRDYKYPSNTYLNEMTRRQYRDLFREHFDILDETVRDPETGRAFMTDAIREELKDWPDEELFSNQVRFVLRKKARG